MPVLLGVGGPTGLGEKALLPAVKLMAVRVVIIGDVDKWVAGLW